ncbi:hypothetical protein C8F04DRAFT_968127 [Mycena alexandri]|uniref:NmrA-like domain-containing protein n=1 Tax=Mycena alexandri TaxID=1745969 RepID=A0AAD6WUD9_9AGAR|nr:hypothetical protein C8F04DRAFT_968127 [Mycena alexandri]
MKVAIAGANAGVGRCIAESILAHGTHTLIVLSRSEFPALAEHGAIVTPVSYDSLGNESLVAALAGVHTVVSAIGDHSRSASAQLALVHAAVSANVTRFIPSGWSGTDGGEDDIVELYRYKQPVLDALRQSNLKWSHPENGIFLNYLASPTKGIATLKPLKFWIDIENCKATIPGDGNTKLAYTAVEDVGEFVAKALDVPGEWPQSLRIVGATVTHNELIKIAEKVRGKRFEVVYKTVDEYKKDLVSNPPFIYVNMATELSLALLDGRFSFDTNFAGVSHQFVQPSDFVQKWWGSENV